MRIYPDTKTAGFSIIELLIVLSIIGILATVGIPYLFKAKDSASKKATMSELDSIDQTLELFRSDHNSYPKSLDEIVSENYAPKDILADSWGTRYQYIASETDGKVQSYMLFSAGPDLKFGTKDDIKSKQSHQE